MLKSCRKHAWCRQDLHGQSHEACSGVALHRAASSASCGCKQCHLCLCSTTLCPRLWSTSLRLRMCLSLCSTACCARHTLLWATCLLFATPMCCIVQAAHQQQQQQQQQPVPFSARGPSAKPRRARGRPTPPIKAVEIDMAGCSYNPVRGLTFASQGA